MSTPSHLSAGDYPRSRSINCLETSYAAPLRDLDHVPERIRQLAMLRGLGYSFREIGKQLGVSPQAVSLMLSRHRRAFKSLGQAMELGNLSARAVNALGRHGIRTRAEARQRGVLDLLQDERNCGRKTLDEIARWLEDDSASSVPSSVAEEPRRVA